MISLKKWWKKLPTKWKKELTSAFHTFVTVFISTFGVVIGTPKDTSWTKETLFATLFAAFVAGSRAGFKAVWNWYFPPTK